MGDLGGVMEVMIIVFGFFMQPVSENNFIIAAISKIYMARTSDNNLF
jgi:hypothetical protein